MVIVRFLQSAISRALKKEMCSKLLFYGTFSKEPLFPEQQTEEPQVKPEIQATLY